jgi:flavoprotein
MCTHHWIIEIPAGPYSYGRCKFCGEQRYFANAEGETATMRKCKGCGKTKPATPEFFRSCGLTIRLRRTCIECELVPA